MAVSVSSVSRNNSDAFIMPFIIDIVILAELILLSVFSRVSNQKTYRCNYETRQNIKEVNITEENEFGKSGKSENKSV